MHDIGSYLEVSVSSAGQQMISINTELVRSRSSTLAIGSGKQSRLQRLKNGLPHGSVLAFLFNTYIHDLPATTAKKFAYADDLAILPSASKWQALEKTLTQDMTTLSSYLQKGKLNLIYPKTMSAAFYLTTWRHSLSLKSLSKADPIFLCQTNLPRLKAGKSAHVLSTFVVTSQEVNNLGWALETTSEIK